MSVIVLVGVLAALVSCNPSPQLNLQSQRRGRTPNAKGDYSFRFIFILNDFIQQIKSFHYTSFANGDQRARQARSESGVSLN